MFFFFSVKADLCLKNRVIAEGRATYAYSAVQAMLPAEEVL
jgi:hypothetical protein